MKFLKKQEQPTPVKQDKVCFNKPQVSIMNVSPTLYVMMKSLQFGKTK